MLTIVWDKLQFTSFPDGTKVRISDKGNEVYIIKGKRWVPEIIWNNCAEQMPPDDFRYRVILKRSRKLEAMSGQEVHDVAARRNSNRLTMQWAEFTREKWEALNK